MRSLLNKLLAVCLVVLIIAAPSMNVFAEGPIARNLNVLRVDGNDAFLSWGLGGWSMEPISGQRLGAGNVMSTGPNTQVYMNLDAASIVKMGELSQLSVDAAGNRLTLSIHSGSALVDLEGLEEHHTLEIRIGGTVMTVSGTLFVAALRESGAAVFTMLSGDGVVYIADETGAVVVAETLRAGYVFWAYDYTVPEEFSLVPLDLHTMNLFELQETYNYQDYLLRIGAITPAIQQLLPQMIGIRQEQRDAVRAAWDVPVVPAPTPEPVQVPVPVPVQAVSVGDIIQFGNYDWRVLDVQDGRVLLLSEYVLFERNYHHISEEVTWETSDIRRYLNNNFFGRFSPQDQARIVQTNVVNNNNPWDFSDWERSASTPGGNNTLDRIFLLSIDEVLRYFGDSGLVARGATMGALTRSDNAPTWPEWGIYGWGVLDRYSEARVAFDLEGEASWWWLRSPGGESYNAAAVFDIGGIHLSGGAVFWEGEASGIRPALWLNLAY